MKTKLDLPQIQNTYRAESKKLDNKKFIPDEMKNIARDYEAQFAELMLEEMNKATGAASDGTANNYYNSLLRKEHSKQLAQNNGGLGIQDMILNDIYPKRLRNEIQYNSYLARKEQFLKDKIKQKNLDTNPLPELNKEVRVILKEYGVEND